MSRAPALATSPRLRGEVAAHKRLTRVFDALWAAGEGQPPRAQVVHRPLTRIARAIRPLPASGGDKGIAEKLICSCTVANNSLSRAENCGKLVRRKRGVLGAPRSEGLPDRFSS